MYWIMRYWWRVRGEIYLFGWLAPQESFEAEMQLLQQRVDQLFVQRHRVVLAGTSAGASAVINAFAGRSDIAKVVNIDGRVRKGNYVGRRSLASAAEHNQIFEISVLRCEQALESFGPDRLAKILTIVPLADEIVPADTVIINGAKNVKVWCVEHGLSIFFAMMIRRWTIKKFISS